MVHDIKIYGEISNGSGRKGYCGLVDVQNQLEKAEGMDIRVRINSVGGDVDEGFAIYSELRKYASENRARVTTLTEGRCASIATVIFLAGDERIVSKYVDPFIHNAWTEVAGSANEFRAIANELDKTNQRIAQHYADHTNLSYEQALELMGADTSLKPDECLRLRFATKVESIAKPLALKNALKQTENYNTNFDMNYKNKKERFSLLNTIGEALGIKVKPDFKDKIVFTADSKEIDFYELGEDEIVEAGAKATIDGQPANGEYMIPDIESGETKKYVFENGTLIEILEPEADETDVEALKAELEALKAEKATLDVEVEALNKEAEQTAEMLNALNEKYTAEVKEKNTFKAKALSLEAKIKGASSAPIVDKKGNEGKETKSEVSDAVLAYKQSKFKNNK